jgi:hypothetical protein
MQRGEEFCWVMEAESSKFKVEECGWSLVWWARNGSKDVLLIIRISLLRIKTGCSK